MSVVGELVLVSETNAPSGDLPLSFSVPEQFRSIDFAVSAEDNTNHAGATAHHFEAARLRTIRDLVQV
ncbi:hypothetical protein CLV40_12927 [Actinokineospora auranticolor]|uniref:Uncharacterized protein n=2 Tax=Actinokineospora auranticolor TaxID=155976 RepID=A0A2S6GDI9_9PSEU|nr:hypothetical protein CLV40_12927 [Actinokineospora auranticolor]